jgi:hypothetical protein
MSSKEYNHEYYLKHRDHIIKRTLEYYYTNQVNEDFMNRKRLYDREYYKQKYLKKKENRARNGIINISKGEYISFK